MQRCLASLTNSLPSTSGRNTSLRAGQYSQWNWAGSSQSYARPPKHRDARRRALCVCAAANRPSNLTLGQRWLSVKHDVYEKAEGVKSWIRALPPIAALFKLMHAIQLFFQPYQERYLAAKEAVKGWWRVRDERYREFIGEETKRQWEWQVRHEQEHNFWQAVVHAIWGIAATMLWEVCTPATFVLAVLPPLWVAWALHDNVFKSPIFYGILLMAPLKFPLWAPIRWI